MWKKLPRCEVCGRPFRPDRFNVEHQKYCSNPDCVRARKRKRQREWYAKRRAEDPQFRADENARCADANRRRREREREYARAGPSPGLCAEPPTGLRDVVAGLLSQVADTSDPRELQQHMELYAARGRRLARLAPTGTGGP